MAAKLRMPLIWASVIMLVLAASIGTATAYFTTYTKAEGSYTLEMKDQYTEIDETFDDWTKHVVIENTGEAACFVRVKAFAGSEYELKFEDPNGVWFYNAEDGYYYCKTVVPAGGKTPELNIKIILPNDKQTEQNFNVVVIQESTRALYEKDGTAYADWTAVLDSTTANYGKKEA